MDVQVMAAAGGVIAGVVFLAHMMRRAHWNRELTPVSDQWLAEQRGRRDA